MSPKVYILVETAQGSQEVNTAGNQLIQMNLKFYWKHLCSQECVYSLLSTFIKLISKMCLLFRYFLPVIISVDAIFGFVGQFNSSVEKKMFINIMNYYWFDTYMNQYS